MTAAFERHGFTYQVAGPEHDGEIARLLNDNDIPGWISLSYRTQPGSHHPLATQLKSDTIIGVDRDGRAGGIATRSVHRAFMDGEAGPVGWLGQLRIDRDLRHRAHLLRAGFEAVEMMLHDPAETPFYFASVIEGNDAARRLLERGLHGFPRFEPLFGYEVLAITADADGRSGMSTGSTDIDEIASFVNAAHRSRDLAVELEADELRHGEWTGLTPADFIALRSGGKIAAAAAIWDQHPHRSIEVTGYRAPLARMRRLANLAAPWAGLPRLPAIGQPLRQAYLSFPVVAADDPRLWVELVRAGLAAASRKGARLLALGFAEGDPAAAVVARAFRHRSYRSTIYRVAFGDASNGAPAKPRAPKVEIGLL